MFARYLTLVLGVSLTGGPTQAALRPRMDAIGTTIAGHSGKAQNEDERDLAPCPTLSCVPSVHVSTLDQVKAPGGGESNFYATLGTSPFVCQHGVPTVIQLAGFDACSDEIASVQFILYYNGAKIRGYTETSAPYTAFGDDPTAGTYNSKVLVPGGYGLSVTVRNAHGCKVWVQSFKFTVSECITGAPSYAPTDSPTPNPSHFDSTPTSDPTGHADPFLPTPNPSHFDGVPTSDPTQVDTTLPTPNPSHFDGVPTSDPTHVDTTLPSLADTSAPTHFDNGAPTSSPTLI